MDEQSHFPVSYDWILKGCHRLRAVHLLCTGLKFILQPKRMDGESNSKSDTVKIPSHSWDTVIVRTNLIPEEIIADFMLIWDAIGAVIKAARKVRPQEYVSLLLMKKTVDVVAVGEGLRKGVEVGLSSSPAPAPRSHRSSKQGPSGVEEGDDADRVEKWQLLVLFHVHGGFALPPVFVKHDPVRDRSGPLPGPLPQKEKTRAQTPPPELTPLHSTSSYGALPLRSVLSPPRRSHSLVSQSGTSTNHHRQRGYTSQVYKRQIGMLQSPSQTLPVQSRYSSVKRTLVTRFYCSTPLLALRLSIETRRGGHRQ